MRLSQVWAVPIATPSLTYCSRCSGELQTISTVIRVPSPASASKTRPIAPIASNTSRSGGGNLNVGPSERHMQMAGRNEAEAPARTQI